MKWIKKISILLLVLLFFISTTGFTLYIHICSCVNTTKHVVFNEIFKSKPLCCCEKTPNHKHTLDHSNSFDNAACCKNQYLLIKSASYMLPVIHKSTEEKTTKLLSLYIPVRTFVSNDNYAICEKLISHYFPPPLLYGKSLLISFNQFKIPLSV